MLSQGKGKSQGERVGTEVVRTRAEHDILTAHLATLGMLSRRTANVGDCLYESVSRVPAEWMWGERDATQGGMGNLGTVGEFELGGESHYDGHDGLRAGRLSGGCGGRGVG